MINKKKVKRNLKPEKPKEEKVEKVKISNFSEEDSRAKSYVIHETFELGQEIGQALQSSQQ